MKIIGIFGAIAFEKRIIFVNFLDFFSGVEN